MEGRLPLEVIFILSFYNIWLGPLSLSSNLEKISPVVAQIFLFFIVEVVFHGRSSSIGSRLHIKFP